MIKVSPEVIWWQYVYSVGYSLLMNKHCSSSIFRKFLSRFPSSCGVKQRHTLLQTNTSGHVYARETLLKRESVQTETKMLHVNRLRSGHDVTTSAGSDSPASVRINRFYTRVRSLFILNIKSKKMSV